MKKIAIVHPELGYVGIDAIPIWIIEALREEYDLSLITTSFPDFDKLNDFFASSLGKDIKVVTIPLPKLLSNTFRGRLIKLHFLMRFCKKYNRDFDLFIGSYGEMDFGKKGIQYINFPEINTEAKFVLKSFFYRNSFPRKIYQNLSYLISRYSKKNIKNNLTLVSSKWAKKIVDDFYGINSTVVYPPVLDDFEKIDWQGKENGFVFMGRISPDKRPLELIQIFKKLREKGFDVHIHIIGNEGMDSIYVSKVKQEAKNNSWIFYEGKVSREKLTNIVSKHKYGINGKKFEHFGIVVAEMLKAGCIVFVPNGGGQGEIVGKNENLIFHSDKDAVNKIIKVLIDEQLQNEILQKLSLQSQQFGKEIFIKSIKEIIKRFLEKKDNN